ncbi:restriction endonuclease subunit S [Zhongshania sp. BJYM1]|uniref:restriction endonuclease subunit S n=1 Tax=Zhongshania aquatica TaxID=2965069 RepID=UPI0022B53817|nr:restriction endonuclease subunit S [Marortus sp. BJYM1]
MKRYPDMRETELSWTNSLPAHWDERRGKFLFYLKKRPIREEDEVITAFRDGQVTLRTNRRTEGFTNSLKEIGYQGVRKGDLVIHAMDGFAGAIGVSDSDGKCSPVYSCCVGRNGINADFYAYLLRNMAKTGFIESLAKGIRERSTDFRWNDFAELGLPLPPAQEQTRISTTLDRETARIDALVEKKARFIELLKEKRQAVITQAVTNGLAPNVPMKDSGVEWIGAVPEDWSVLALKRLVSTPITDGPHETPTKYDEGVPFVSAEAVRLGKIDFQKIWGHISRADHARYSKKYSPQVGDIYMVKSGATTGVTAIVEDDREFNIWSPLAAIRPNELVEPRFLLAALRSTPFIDGIAINWSYGTQQNIGMKTLSDLPVVLPPIEYQRDILTILDADEARYDRLLNATERSVALLNERRSALIAAAVTGQIDLRDTV